MPTIARPTILEHFVDDTTALTAERLNALDGGLRLYSVGGAIVNSSGTVLVRVAVSSGKIFWDGAHRSVSETHFQVTDTATTYVWYSGTAVTSGSAWPAYYHYRIGEVTTSGGRVTRIVDHRTLVPGSLLHLQYPTFSGTLMVNDEQNRTIVRTALLVGYRIECVTGPSGGDLVFDLLNADSGSVFTDAADRPTVTSGQTSGGTTLQTWTGTQPLLLFNRYILRVISANSAANVSVTLELRA